MQTLPPSLVKIHKQFWKFGVPENSEAKDSLCRRGGRGRERRTRGISSSGFDSRFDSSVGEGSVSMALSMTHQIGALAGKPIQPETSTGESTATLSAAAVWKAPAAGLRCRARAADMVDSVSPPVSPCRSPVLGPIRADLTAACSAFEVEVPPREYAEGKGKAAKGKGVPVYVMMPLDSVTMNNTVNRRKAMNASLQALKSAGVEGVMMDVWWGLVERDSPGSYKWGGYAELLEMAKKHGLKVQAVMSFHQCGGNVGDSCLCVSHLPLSPPLFFVFISCSFRFCMGFLPVYSRKN